MLALAEHLGSSEPLKGLMTRFLEDSPNKLDAIRAAVEQRDPQALAFAAHALKGSALNFQAEALAAAATQLERMGRQGDLGESEQVLGELEAEYYKVRQTLIELRGQGGE